MSLRVIVFAFSLLLSGPLMAATILVWGDSLSAGYQLRQGEEWPVLLQARLEENGYAHHVVNGSVSGETTSGGLSRLPAALEQHEPDLFLLELGGNDGLRGLQPQLMADNLEAMITAAQDAGAEVLLIGMELPPNYGPFAERFTAAFADVAERTDVIFLPFLLAGFADRPDHFLPDGIHPTAQSQHLILDTVWEVLHPMLEKSAVSPAKP